MVVHMMCKKVEVSSGIFPRWYALPAYEWLFVKTDLQLVLRCWPVCLREDQLQRPHRHLHLVVVRLVRDRILLPRLLPTGLSSNCVPRFESNSTEVQLQILRNVGPPPVDTAITAATSRLVPQAVMETKLG